MFRAFDQAVVLGLLLFTTCTQSLCNALSTSSTSPHIVHNVDLRERDASSQIPGGFARLTTSKEGVYEIDFVYEPTRKINNLLRISPLKSLQSLVLPAGYPRSVPREYAAFQTYNCLQDACSYLRNIFSTSAILKGLGVGNADTTAAAATLLWILRDGFSLVGSLAFATFASVRFGQNVKQWRLFADSINNIGLTLEVIAGSTVFANSRPIFLGLLSAASICKALCGVAAGATNAAILQHWGFAQGNVGDIAAKNGMQHTIVSLVLLFVSAPFIEMTGSLRPAQTWAFYLLLTALHMALNYQAMRVLALRSLNYTRATLLISKFLSLSKQDTAAAAINTESGSESPLSPRAIARLEPLLLQPSSPRRKAIAHFSSLKTLVSSCSPEAISKSLQIYHSLPYFICPRTDGKGVVVCMRDKHLAVDTLKSLFEANVATMSAETLLSMTSIEQTRRSADATWSLFLASVKANDWDLDRLLLSPKDATTVSAC